MGKRKGTDEEKRNGFLQEWGFLRKVCCPALMGIEEIKEP